MDRIPTAWSGLKSSELLGDLIDLRSTISEIEAQRANAIKSEKIAADAIFELVPLLLKINLDICGVTKEWEAKLQQLRAESEKVSADLVKAKQEREEAEMSIKSIGDSLGSLHSRMKDAEEKLKAAPAILVSNETHVKMVSSLLADRTLVDPTVNFGPEIPDARRQEIEAEFLKFKPEI